MIFLFSNNYAHWTLHILNTFTLNVRQVIIFAERKVNIFPWDFFFLNRSRVAEPYIRGQCILIQGTFSSHQLFYSVFLELIVLLESGFSPLGSTHSRHSFYWTIAEHATTLLNHFLKVFVCILFWYFGETIIFMKF